MNLIELLSLLGIVLGAVFMSLGILKTRKVIPLLLTERQKSRWKMLWGMMTFFLAGYVVTLYVVAKPLSAVLVPLTSVVFLVGAMFVLQVVRVGFDTVKDLGDVVEQRTESLEQALEELEANVKAREKLNLELSKSLSLKDQFLSSMSHELRTPLSGVLGMSEALSLELYGPLGERQKSAVDTIEKCGKQLLDLINSILELTKLEGGEVSCEPEIVNLGSLINETLTGITPQLELRKLVLRADESSANVSAYTDPRKLKQILRHLLSNAIKFSEEGGELGVRYRELPGEDHVEISVWDKGVGISEQNLTLLFQAFVQGDGSLKRTHEGSGLGLAIVAHLVKLQGGTIDVRSTFGEGSEFLVRLPKRPKSVS